MNKMVSHTKFSLFPFSVLEPWIWPWPEIDNTHKTIWIELRKIERGPFKLLAFDFNMIIVQCQYNVSHRMWISSHHQKQNQHHESSYFDNNCLFLSQVTWLHKLQGSTQKTSYFRISLTSINHWLPQSQVFQQNPPPIPVFSVGEQLFKPTQIPLSCVVTLKK